MPVLTPKQKKFCQEYIVDLNATQAAIRAGYSKKSASRIGVELLNKTQVSNYLQGIREKQEKRTEITADRVLKELANIAFLDPSKIFDENNNLIPIKDMPKDVRSAIGGLDVSEVKIGENSTTVLSKIKVIDKKGALELIGKHLKMWTEKHELTGENGGPIRFNGMSDDELRELLTRTA